MLLAPRDFKHPEISSTTLSRFSDANTLRSVHEVHSHREKRKVGRGAACLGPEWEGDARQSGSHSSGD